MNEQHKISELEYRYNELRRNMVGLDRGLSIYRNLVMTASKQDLRTHIETLLNNIDFIVDEILRLDPSFMLNRIGGI